MIEHLDKIFHHRIYKFILSIRGKFCWLKVIDSKRLKDKLDERKHKFQDILILMDISGVKLPTKTCT